jgi:HD-GYP domain-containing protein (c-di-GMP phosphodiesterase class II)
MSVAEATEMIEREAGRQFDPAVVAAFKARKEALVAILKQQRAQKTSAAELTPQRDERVLEKAS